MILQQPLLATDTVTEALVLAQQVSRGSWVVKAVIIEKAQTSHCN
jgi:hypothetical protein